MSVRTEKQDTHSQLRVANGAFSTKDCHGSFLSSTLLLDIAKQERIHVFVVGLNCLKLFAISQIHELITVKINFQSYFF